MFIPVDPLSTSLQATHLELILITHFLILPCGSVRQTGELMFIPVDPLSTSLQATHLELILITHIFNLPCGFLILPCGFLILPCG